VFFSYQGNFSGSRNKPC